MNKVFVVLLGVGVVCVLAVAGLFIWKAGAPAAPVPEVPETASTTITSPTTTSPVSVTEEEFDKGGVAPSLMSLSMKEWEWQEAEYADGRKVAPSKAGVFTLTFGAGGGVEIGTDCNSMSSTYEAYSGTLKFGPVASTKMFCEGSQETEFAQLLSTTSTYQFTGKGELIVKTADGTKVTFR